MNQLLLEVKQHLEPEMKEHITRNYRVMHLFMQMLFGIRIVSNRVSHETGEHRKQIWRGLEVTTQAYNMILEKFPMLKHAHVLKSIPTDTGTYQVTFTIVHGEINPYSINVVSASDVDGDDL